MKRSNFENKIMNRIKTREAIIRWHMMNDRRDKETKLWRKLESRK